MEELKAELIILGAQKNLQTSLEIPSDQALQNSDIQNPQSRQGSDQMIDQMLLSMISEGKTEKHLVKKNSWRQSATVSDRKSSIEMGTKKSIVSSLRSFFSEEFMDSESPPLETKTSSDHSDDEIFHNTNNPPEDEFPNSPKNYGNTEIKTDTHKNSKYTRDDQSVQRSPHPTEFPNNQLKIDHILGLKEKNEEGKSGEPAVPAGLMSSPSQINGGYLFKRGAIRKTWKKRWFYIRRNRLYYSTSPSADYINFIRIDHETKVYADSQRSEFGFVVETVDRNYVLCASNEKEQKQWIQSVTDLIEVQRDKQQVRTSVLPTGWSAKPLVDLILIEATNLLETESYYCLIKCDDSPWCKTRTIKGDMPIWNEDFTFLINSCTSSLMIDLYVCGTLNDKLISSYVLPISEFSRIKEASFSRLHVSSSSEFPVSGSSSEPEQPSIQESDEYDESVYEGWISAHSLYPLTSNLYTRPSTLLSPREDHFDPRTPVGDPLNSLSSPTFSSSSSAPASPMPSTSHTLSKSLECSNSVNSDPLSHSSTDNISSDVSSSSMISFSSPQIKPDDSTHVERSGLKSGSSPILEHRRESKRLSRSDTPASASSSEVLLPKMSPSSSSSISGLQHRGLGAESSGSLSLASLSLLSMPACSGSEIPANLFYKQLANINAISQFKKQIQQENRNSASAEQQGESGAESGKKESDQEKDQMTQSQLVDATKSKIQELSQQQQEEHKTVQESNITENENASEGQIERESSLNPSEKTGTSQPDGTAATPASRSGNTESVLEATSKSGIQKPPSGRANPDLIIPLALANRVTSHPATWNGKRFNNPPNTIYSALSSGIQENPSSDQNLAMVQGKLNGKTKARQSETVRARFSGITSYQNISSANALAIFGGRAGSAIIPATSTNGSSSSTSPTPSPHHSPRARSGSRALGGGTTAALGSVVELSDLVDPQKQKNPLSLWNVPFISAHPPVKLHLAVQFVRNASGVDKGFLSTFGIPTKAIQRRLDTGDIILFSCADIRTWLTKVVTRSSWDHCAMVVRNRDNTLSVLESTMDGVQTYTLQPHLQGYRLCSTLGIRRLNIIRTPQMYGKLYSFIEDVRGRPYKRNLMELVRAATKSSSGGNTVPDLTSIFCSELTAAAYQKMGLLSEEALSNNFLPKDFSAADFPLLHGKLELVRVFRQISES